MVEDTEKFLTNISFDVAAEGWFESYHFAVFFLGPAGLVSSFLVGKFSSDSKPLS